MITKIRIGNDIKLAVNIRLYNLTNKLKESDVYNPRDVNFENIDNNEYVNKSTELYYNNYSRLASGDSDYVDSILDVYYGGENHTIVNDELPINIRSIKAILVNTSRAKKYEDLLNKKTRFISRFPIEPYVNAFDATNHNIRCSGNPTWRAYPIKHYFAPYCGFGVTPDWNSIYPTCKHNDVEYIADASATSDPNVISVLFPAKHLLHIGEYKLIIVAKLYVPGYNKYNLKTVTIDLNKVFELVSSSEEAHDGNITINVNTES